MTRLSKLVNIFLSPVDVFNELKDKSDWVFPLLILILVGAISTLVLLPNVITPQQVDKIINNPDLSVEQKNAALQYMKGPFMYIFPLLGVFIGVPVVYLVLAGALIVVRLVFGGDSISFKKLLSAVAYIGIVGALGQVFGTLVALSQKTLNVSLSPGLFLTKSDSLVYEILNKLDIFTIWETILFGLLLMVFYRYSRAKAFSIVFGFLALLIVGTSILF